MAKIGLFGYYAFLNFGDDLMALMIARHLADAGHHVTIYGIKEEVAATVSAQATSSIEELVSSSDACLVGGGAWLSEFSGNTNVNRSKTNRDCLELARHTRQRSVPVYALSIGGSSSSPDRSVRTGFMALLTNPTFRGGTTRLRSDLEFLNTLFAPFEYYPDIVFSLLRALPEFSRPARDSNRSQLIAINSRPGVRDAALIHATAGMFSRSRNVNVAFVHNNAMERDQFLKAFPWTRSFEHEFFLHPRALVEFLANACLLTSPRLHMGIAAMCVGTPFIPYNPVAKVRLFLDDLGWNSMAISTRASRLPGLLLKFAKIDRLSSKLLFPIPKDLDDVSARSAGHFRCLDQMLH